LLSRLRRIKREAEDKVLGVVDVDLYTPGFDFVFGEAEIASGVATLSLHRLRPGSYGSPADESLFYERAVKEAVHELGHLYGLGHCPNRRCVMSFSTNLSKVDRKRRAFCPECTAEQEGS
jgi:archaemetzincin